MAKKKDDPTVTSAGGGDAYPEGTHPARDAAETTHFGGRIKYEDNPDKPSPSSIAQVAVLPDDFPGR